MILADKIIAGATPLQGEPVRQAVAAFGRHVAHARKFVLADDVAMACHHVANAKPSAISSALGYCRAPFRDTWLEWSFDAVVRAGGYDAPRPATDIIPKRVGCLLSLDESMQRGRVFLAWDNGSPPLGVSLSFVESLVDWTSHPCLNSTHDDIKRLILEKKERLSARVQKCLSDTTELYCLIEHERRHTDAPCAFYNDFFKDLLLAVNQELVCSLLIKSGRDWDGELRFIMATLIMLNSRNCVSIDSADLTRLNKSRQRRGVPTFAEYSTININLSNALRRAAVAQGAGRAAMVKHLVRGHFKVRKSGVFWWSPYVRGEIGKVQDRRYTLAS